MAHKVLLVDDEPNVLMALRRALRKEPYQILTACSGNEALDLLETTEIDVVVSDQEMPGMTGTELLSRVDMLYPDTMRFMLTGKATLDTAIQAINKGAITRFFTKPCNELDLVITIRQALEHKDLMTQAWRLLKKVKRQNALLEGLEHGSAGIAQVGRESTGVIDLDEDDLSAIDYDAFIEELHRTLGD